MAGRPPGTFEDPSVRMQNWHWAANVMRIAGVKRLTELDRQAPRHELVQPLAWGRYFEAIGLDGSSPGRIRVAKDPEKSLLDHVAADKRYAEAMQGYRHRLWAHLELRDPAERPSDTWMSQVLSERKVLALEEEEDSRKAAVGFEWITDEPFDDDQPLPIQGLAAFSPDKFADLDGILVLTLLLREAVDGSADQHEQWVPGLRRLLREAAQKFSLDHRFEGEAQDTWQLIVETRLLTWRPEVTPSKDNIESARKQLLAQRVGQKRRVGQIDSGRPEARVRGRAERRWRRQVTIRAMVLAVIRKD
jgi:hypothetical protein